MLENTKEVPKKNIQKIGTFNCQGLATKQELKLRTLVDDFERYKLTILAIQETHLKGFGVIAIKSSTNKEYLLYYSGNTTKSENGVGIIIPKTKNVNFTPYNDRICQITTKINNTQTLNIICVYAPTLQK